MFYTDQYAVYSGIIPAAQHKAITKQARKTNHIERFNGTEPIVLPTPAGRSRVDFPHDPSLVARPFHGHTSQAL